MTNVNKTQLEISLGNYILVKENITSKVVVDNNNECLICLDIINIESCDLISLPCKCSNSIYHKDCLVKMLLYGPNKNFCPHCKQKYNIFESNTTNTTNTSNNITLGEQENRIILDEMERNEQNQKTNICVTVFHMIFNSIINVFSGNLIMDENTKNTFNKTLLYMNIFKIFFNSVCIYVMKKKPEQFYKIMISSYTLQFIIFCYTIALFIKKFNSKEKFTFIAIIVINFGISLIDIGFRKIFRDNRG